MLCLRERRSRIALGYGLACFLATELALIGYFFLKDLGLYTSNLKSLKFFKDHVLELYQINFNPIAYSLIISSILSFFVFDRRPVLKKAVLSATVFIALLSGAATAILSFLIAYVTLFSIRTKRFKLWLALVSLAGLTAAYLGFTYLDGYTLNEMTTGRFSLWSAAVSKFRQSPLVGWGANSWKADLSTFLPMYNPERFDSLLELESGGFHNAYLGLLAEKGLAGFLPGLLMLGYLIRQSLKLFRRRDLMGWPDSSLAARTPLVMIMTATQYLAEQSGLFGFGNGAVDFLSFSMASLIVALAAESDALVARGRREECARC
jgi:O-antigen ligase